MSQHSIENDYLRITVKEKGAELSSLVRKTDDLEYMWQGDPAFWGRHAPVLFPFVGKLKENKYTYNGHDYEIGQHGFARDNTFELISKTNESIVFELSSNEETDKKYPFDFSLRISYTLEDMSVKVGYQVSNNAINDKMYFSIGAHPAFNCPIDHNSERKDYYLRFNTPETPQSFLLEGGNFSGQQKDVFDEPGRIDLTDALFDQDALVFKEFKSDKVSLVRKSNDEPYLTVSFEGFPYLGIWSKNSDSPFVCIEPWYGLADNKGHEGDLTQKEGIIAISSKESFSCDHYIEVH